MAPQPRHVIHIDDLDVVDNEAVRRYESWLDGEMAGWIMYRPEGGWIVLIHTESLPGFSGRGVAGRMVKAALDDIRARGLYVTPSCPYVAAYIKQHPEYKDLVVGVRGPRAPG